VPRVKQLVAEGEGKRLSRTNRGSETVLNSERTNGLLKANTGKRTEGKMRVHEAGSMLGVGGERQRTEEFNLRWGGIKETSIPAASRDLGGGGGTYFSRGGGRRIGHASTRMVSPKVKGPS